MLYLELTAVSFAVGYASYYFPLTPSENYGGVYVGLPSDAAAMVSSQTKTAPKGIEKLCIAFLPLSWLNFI
uniref:Uncharacterized protein n=1 Tax=Phasianus colchicus TaxID=9054 RepID=A0A669QII9_PHACC